MIRGTTPINTFTLPFVPPDGTCFRIVYAQGPDYEEKTLFELTTKRCTVDGSVISVRLKQEETLMFDSSLHYYDGKHAPYPIKIQVGVETPGNDISWGDIIVTTVERCLRRDGAVCLG